MAIPFKRDHFRFQRQVELEQELLQSPLYRQMDQVCATTVASRDKAAVQQGYPVPLKTFPALQAAALRFQTVARLSHTIELQLDVKPSYPTRCRPVMDGKRLVFIVAPTLLQETRPEALAYHLAMNYFRALHPMAMQGVALLNRKGPIHLDDRIKLLELLRLTAYAADAFALVCCGSLEVAQTEGFRAGFDVSLPPAAMNLKSFAKHGLTKPAFPVSKMIDHPTRGATYRPGRMPVLERFAVSEPHHACLGQPGGVPREVYEEEVLAIDWQVHPPMKELSKEAAELTRFAFFFGTVFVMGATGTITKQREQVLCNFREMPVEKLRQVEQDLDWDVRDHATTRTALEGTLRAEADLANVHCVEILRRAYLLARHEHGEKLPAETLAALEQLGLMCQLNEAETRLVCDCVARELAKIPDEEK